MKSFVGLMLLMSSLSASAGAWKVLPKGVRIVGIRNVSTGTIDKNFNQSGQESSLGASFRIDASTFNAMTGNLIVPGKDIDQTAYNNFVLGEYKVDADAQFNVNGLGFGYGITDRVMFYAEIAHYQARIRARMKRTSGNTIESTARLLDSDPVLAENVRQMVDADEGTIQSVITNYYGYKPVGDWYGTGYGDMETGVMMKLLDYGITGLTFYPGVVLPTGTQDDPDILQDQGFGDGQFDVFGEMATGYVLNDKVTFGSFLRLTYQAPTTKNLRIPEERDFQLSDRKGDFRVKYGNKLNFTLNSTLTVNDWVSFTPVYRFMVQERAQYNSNYGAADDYLAYRSERLEHQAQLTTTFSSITPFLKKQFLLPAQVNVNLVKTMYGNNVPAQERFEVEFRMLF
jgi:hypothetical protein